MWCRDKEDHSSYLTPLCNPWISDVDSHVLPSILISVDYIRCDEVGWPEACVQVLQHRTCGYKMLHCESSEQVWSSSDVGQSDATHTILTSVRRNNAGCPHTASQGKGAAHNFLSSLVAACKHSNYWNWDTTELCYPVPYLIIPFLQ
jgi:hypothetical protein